jgi:hypothetical protein
MARLAAVLVLSSTVLAGSGLELVQKHLERGEKAVKKVEELKSDAKRLKALREAELYFGRALRHARSALEKAGEEEIAPLEGAAEAASSRLVAVLNGETVLFIRRGAYGNAKKANRKALALLPKDVRAKELAEEVADPPEDELDALTARAGVAHAAALKGLLGDPAAARSRYAERRQGMAGSGTAPKIG